MLLLKKRLVIFLLLSVFVLLFHLVVHAQTSPTPTPTNTPADNSQAISDLQNKIKGLQDKITELQGQEKSLSSDIDTMDSQIAITQYRITLTQRQITDTEMDIDTTQQKITDLQSSLDGLTKVLLSRIVATYEIGSAQPPLAVLASSNTVSDFITRANYLRIAQEHDKELVYNTVQAKNDYANQQEILKAKEQQIVSLQADLQNYTTQLDSQKADKEKLLADTQGSESNYEHLLAQAKAQLEGFSSFTSHQGGSSLLGNQTVCDSWGCYYNQRDSSWGGLALNGTQYTIASDGCLMTSMAMVITHYGTKVTPVDINSNSNNFASYYPAYLLYTISAGGVTAKRESAAIDATLNDSNHDPVIVGISYDGGPLPDHFVVLVSGSGGSYIMNDPYTPNGHNISFNSLYSVGSIREVDRVVIE